MPSPLHILVGVTVTSSPGLAFCWDPCPVAPCLPGLLLLLPPSLHKHFFPTAKKAQTFPIGLFFSEKPLGVVSRSLRISPLTVAHVPRTPLCRSHILSRAPANHLFPLFFPPTALSLHPYVTFKSQTRQDSNFFCLSMCLVTSLCLLALLKHFTYK